MHDCVALDKPLWPLITSSLAISKLYFPNSIIIGEAEQQPESSDFEQSFPWNQEGKPNNRISRHSRFRYVRNKTTLPRPSFWRTPHRDTTVPFKEPYSLILAFFYGGRLVCPLLLFNVGEEAYTT